MKVWILMLLRKVRLRLEQYGIKSPEWMFRGSDQIKRWIGAIKPVQQPIVPAGHVIHISREQQALDLAYLSSLHGASSILPIAGTHLMVDLRVAQVNRERGIPRYAQTLAIELARQCPDIRYSWLIDEGDVPLLEQSLALYGQFVRVEDISLLPRITHYLQSCMFDRSRDATVLFPASLAVHQPQLGALFYDMIPWVFPQLYLRDPTTANGYMRAAELLPAVDRLFAITECVRIDAIAFGCDPKRVTTIYGGWDPDRFNTAPAVPPALPGNYWLYIGGDDPRKNISGLIQAFAKVRQCMPSAPALVIVCGLTPSRRAELLREARVAGLDADGLVLTGYIPDGAMRAVIEGAAATIFPSLYEGLGLPVLESYQYRRPVLVSDNSSLKELAPVECRFDARQPESIAEAVIRFHQDPAIAQASLDYAPNILKMCGWKAAVDLVAGWCAAESAQQDLKETLDIITSLPPDQSGVAIYTQKTLASAPWAIRLFAPWADERLGQAVESMRRVRHEQRSISLMPQILPISDYCPTQRSAVWILGNSEHHIESIDMLARAGQRQDFLYLHEAKLDGVMHAYHMSNAKHSALPKKIQNLNDLLGVIRPRNILVNSEFCSQLVQSLPNAVERKVQKLFLPILDLVPARAPQASKPLEQPLVIMHIGTLAESKQPDKIIKACELIRRNRPVRLILAGYDVAKYFLYHALEQPWMEMQKALSDEELVALMQKADVGIQLRWPQGGESSGAVCQWLGLRKPVITTAGGSFNEFAGAAWLVPPEAGPEELAKAIMRAAELGTPKNFGDFVATRTISAWQTAFQNALALQTEG